MDNIAVVDLGSNTFHILICRFVDGVLTEVFRKRSFVGLSTGGIETIAPDRIAFGLKTVEEFSVHLKEYDVKRFRVVGTSVLREADNSEEFTSPCEALLGQKIDVIDGEEEARLIYEGVRLLDIPLKEVCIIDIGGGSVELIVVKDNKVLGYKSFPIGVGVLHAKFHHQEPIASSDYEACRLFIKAHFGPFFNELGVSQLATVVGASGSFEVLRDGLTANDSGHYEVKDVIEHVERIVGLNLEERIAEESIPEERSKLIVVGMIIVEVLCTMVAPSQVVYSPYAIKEGVLKEMNE